MKELVIVGGGRSVKHGIELGLWDKIKDKTIWSLNYAFMTMPYLPKREVWVDIAFYTNNVESLQKLSEQGVQMVAKRHKKYADIFPIKCYEQTRNRTGYKGKEALKVDGTPHIFLGRMGMCGTFALSLAVAENYEKIYLLGYDFGTPEAGDTKTHFYQGDIQVRSTGVGNTHVYRGGDRSNKNLVKKDVEDYEVYGSDAYIINVSPQSNIPYFQKITYEEFFEELINEGNNSGQ